MYNLVIILISNAADIPCETKYRVFAFWSSDMAIAVASVAVGGGGGRRLTES